VVLSRSRTILTFFAAAIFAVVLAAALVFGGVLKVYEERTLDLSAYASPAFDYRPVAFADLPGWRSDNQSRALKAFIRSCGAISGKADDDAMNGLEHLGERAAGVSLGGTVADWRAPCHSALRLGAGDDAAARSFFENNFKPVQILAVREPLPDGRAKNRPPMIEESGLFTGYFEPIYEASLVKTAQFSAPVYPRPDDLVDVNLGAFREELTGQRLAGRITNGRLVPYPDHREINAGALDNIVEPLAWLHPNDLFFLQIQGSGQLSLGPDEALRAGYAGQNGHPYTAIGKIIVERNILPLSAVTMASIRDWLEKAPPRAAQEMREQNASYVFFTRLNVPVADDFGPLGAQGISLIAERSLAVDRRYHAMGAPVWLDIDPLTEGGATRIQRLMIAQDTGGAIRGPVRGDVFWGAGDDAGAIAGAMRAQGRMFVLIPNAVAARLAPAPDV